MNMQEMKYCDKCHQITAHNGESCFPCFQRSQMMGCQTATEIQKKTLDFELHQMAVVHDALKELDPQRGLKVIKAVAVLLDIKL